MFYVKKEERIVLADAELQRLQNTLKFMPDLLGSQILEGELVRGYDENWYEPEDAPTQPLPEAKAAKLSEINGAYDMRANAVRVDTPDNEVLTWDIQRDEWLKWSADNTVATPFIDGLAQFRGVDRMDLMAKVGQKVMAFQSYMAMLTGKRQGYEDAIAAAETTVEVAGVVWID
jgi:hypothetical protein